MDFDVFTLCDGERTVEQVAWQLLRQQAGAVAGYAQAMEHVARALGRGLDNEWVAVFDPGQGNGAAGDQACSHAAREA